MTSIGAGITTQKHRGYDLSDDCITLFINYQQIAQYKTKVDALAGLKALLKKAPPEVLTAIEEVQYYLLDAIGSQP